MEHALEIFEEEKGMKVWKEGREGMHSWAAQVWQVRHRIDSE